MNKLIIVVLLLTATSCGEIAKKVEEIKNATVENKDGKGKKDKKQRNGEYSSYFSDGKTVKRTINYKDNKRHGLATEYYENGKKKIEMNYFNGVKHGVSKKFYKNGTLYRESVYKNGELNGIRKVYAKGKLKAEIPYKNGYVGLGLKEYLLDGTQKTKYPKIRIKTIDKRYDSGIYEIHVFFDEPHAKDQFWVGKLEDNKYLSGEQMPVKVFNGVGIFERYAPPGTFTMEKIVITGQRKTIQGNPYLTTITYNLALD